MLEHIARIDGLRSQLSAVVSPPILHSCLLLVPSSRSKTLLQGLLLALRTRNETLKTVLARCNCSDRSVLDLLSCSDMRLVCSIFSIGVEIDDSALRCLGIAAQQLATLCRCQVETVGY